MARQRQLIPLSYDPQNVDAVLVLEALAKVSQGKRSATVWRWCAEYLRGNTAEVASSQADADDDLIDLLDAL